MKLEFLFKTKGLSWMNIVAVDRGRSQQGAQSQSLNENPEPLCASVSECLSAV